MLVAGGTPPSAPRLAIAGAALVLIGSVVSGPVAFALVELVHPQPPWQGAARFVAELDAVQAVPYLAGLLLVGGFVMLIAGLHGMAPAAVRARTSAALVCVAVYAALVGINYAVQTTFVPGLAAHYTDADGPVIAAFTMSNPRSLGWALEMWGYGYSGVATWLVAPVLVRGGHGRAAARAFVGNGVVSVVGALATAAWPGWVMTGPGMAAFLGWNLLVVVMAWLAVVEIRARAER